MENEPIQTSPVRKVGRPRKIFSVEDKQAAQRKYRQNWYQKNKDHVRETRDLLQERNRRKMRQKSGYFAIYSGDDMFIAFSKDIESRTRDIIKTIKSKSKNTAFYNKFDNDKEWNWKMLGFCDQPNDLIHDKLVEEELEININLNFI